MNCGVSLRLLALSLALALTNCGGRNDCLVVLLDVGPESGIADHSAPPPGNAQQFLAIGEFAGSCAVPAVFPPMQDVTWSVSDTAHVTISNTRDITFGTATCLNATSGPVDVTATLPANKNFGRTVSATGKLTCN